MNQGLVLEALSLLVFLLKLANSLSDCLGIETASLAEPDGTWACKDTFFHDTIRIPIQCHDTIHDTLHDITTKCLVSCSWAQKFVQLTKPS